MKVAALTSQDLPSCDGEACVSRIEGYASGSNGLLRLYKVAYRYLCLTAFRLECSKERPDSLAQ